MSSRRYHRRSMSSMRGPRSMLPTRGRSCGLNAISMIRRARCLPPPPIFGKKGRPAWQLQVIALPEDVERLEAMVFAETTTIGVRRWTCDRTVLAREETVLETPWGPVRAKRVVLPDGTVRTRPEYEDAATIERREGIALQQVMAAMPSA